MINTICLGIITLSFIFTPLSSIYGYFEISTNISIICDNNYTNCDKNIKNKILNLLEECFLDSYEMPAYGVAIDSEIRENKQCGVWIEFDFSHTMVHNDMPFDKLLMEITPEMYGVNIIRYHNNMYEGRCYHINLSKNMNKIYDFIINKKVNLES